MDYGGSEIAPCGFNRCTLPASSTHLDCEAKCNTKRWCPHPLTSNSLCCAPLTKRAHVTFAHLLIANLPACAVAVSPSGLRRVRVGRRHLLDQGGHAQRRARKLPQFAGAGADGSVPGHWAIKGGDATQGALKVYWDGKRAAGYAPMKKQGAIILGIGGDNSDGAVGTSCEKLPFARHTDKAPPGGPVTPTSFHCAPL